MKRIARRLVKRIASLYPNLKDELRTAHLNVTPSEFIYNNLKFALPFSLGMTVLFFFVADKAGLPMAILPLAFLVFFILVFNFSFLKLKGLIVKRQKEIDREVFFAGQYLLIKLYAGKPLLNALMDTSKSYGVASKYIKEIVDDVDTGSTVEEALQNAMTYSPSEKFRKVLFHLNNALRLGIDVTRPLRSVLDEIIKEQETEVKKYGKKLNSLVIFYMLAAIVVPSIGMTIFVAISSFINLNVSTTHFLIVVFFVAVVQIFFISMFKTIRPTVNI